MKSSGCINNISMKQSRDCVDVDECNIRTKYNLTNSVLQFKVGTIKKEFNSIISTARLTPESIIWTIHQVNTDNVDVRKGSIS